MRAMVRTSFGVLEELEVDVDEPAGDEVLVRVMASGVCHSDKTQLDGAMFGISDDARVLGHEVAGIVEKVGDRVVEFAPGDHVVGCLTRSCGHCERCLEGMPYLCQNRMRIDRERPRLSRNGEPIGQAGQLGGFAEYVLAGEDSLVKLPDDVPFESGALLGCAVVTGVGAVINAARPAVGSTIAVFGCGGVGLNIIQGAVLSGARQIIAVDVSDEKLALAREFGATHVVDGLADDVVDQIRSIAGGGVDAAFESAGIRATALNAFAALKPGHDLYLVGVPVAGVSYDFPAGEIVLNAKQIHGVAMGSTTFKRDIPLLARLYLSGRLKLDELVGERIALSELPAAMDRFSAGGVARSVIVFD